MASLDSNLMLQAAGVWCSPPNEKVVNIGSERRQQRKGRALAVGRSRLVIFGTVLDDPRGAVVAVIIVLVDPETTATEF